VSSIQPVDFGLYDLEGRAAAIEHITPKNVGLLTVRPTGEFKPGIYFARLTQGGHAVGGKVCIIQ
jgi:hypothetical protein